MPAGGAITVGAIAGLSSIIGAGKSSDAATDASRMQSASADRALQVQRETRDQQRQDRSGYLAAGNQAVKYLGDYLGGQQNVAMPGAYSSPYAGAQHTLGGYVNPARAAVGSAYPPTPQGPQGPAQPSDGGPYSMVQMVYPQTGERANVPMAQVKHYQQRGAQVVG